MLRSALRVAWLSILPRWMAGGEESNLPRAVGRATPMLPKKGANGISMPRLKSPTIRSRSSGTIRIREQGKLSVRKRPL
ncbi:hypothetical protein [Sphingobium sp. YBL2]|uniref:hypothetical protein n=1 Tax=Sphingobium sp. (strain YBL2) TaxID=484429 RepID=UPI0012EEA3A8|nr:hypothetical protein [Sphingobium sp. YBL2]